MYKVAPTEPATAVKGLIHINHPVTKILYTLWRHFLSIIVLTLL